jgi:hypothetical protein
LSETTNFVLLEIRLTISRQMAQNWLLDQALKTGFVTFDRLVHHHLAGFTMATAPPTMKATTFTFNMKELPLGPLNFQAGQYIPL